MSKDKQENLSYRVIKVNKRNIYDSEIETSGIVNIFTPRQLIADMDYNDKMEREITANVSIKDAVMKNIAGTNPIVLEMSDKDLCAAYLYYEALAFNKEAKEKLESIVGMRKRNAKLLKLIEEQTGFKIERPTADKKEIIKDSIKS
jgi:hypothetical protein